MPNILLFGGGLQSLSISRGLKEYKNVVHNIADRHAVGKYGRYIDCFCSITLEKFKPQNLVDYINSNNIDLVIPTEDEYAEWLSLYKPVILSPTKAKLAIVDYTTFQTVIDKASLLTFCDQFNIPHPLTINITLDNLHNIPNNISYPILIKPNRSNGSRGISIINNKEELWLKAPQLINVYGDCTLQEFIENDHYYNVMLYRYSDGTWGPYVATKITRFYPVKGGSSCFCSTILNEELIRPCKELLAKLNWTGFADLDVLEKNKGIYKIIEINPRIPASVHAAYVSGVNYGQVMVDDLIYNKKSQMKYRPGEQLRFLGLDIAWFLASPHRFKATPSWFKFLGKHLHYQEGGARDMAAMIYSIWCGVKKQLSPSFRKAKAGMN